MPAKSKSKYYKRVGPFESEISEDEYVELNAARSRDSQETKKLVGEGRYRNRRDVSLPTVGDQADAIERPKKKGRK